MKRFSLYILFLFLAFPAISQINANRALINGRAALSYNDYIIAIQYFNKVIEYKPQLAEAYFFRAIAKIQLEDFTGAINDCHKFLLINPYDPRAYYARGYAQRNLGNHEKALLDFSKALEFNPNNVDYQLSKIEALIKNEKFEDALLEISHLHALNKEKENLLLIEKGFIFFQQGDTIKAFNTFTDAIKKSPKQIEAWGARAYINLISEKDSAALNDYNQAISRNSKNSGHYINRGILNFKLNNYKLALSDYNKAIELDSFDTKSLFNRGILHFKLGDLNNAIKDFSNALSKDDNYDEVRYQRALAFLEINNYVSAKNDLNIIIEKHPNFAPAFYNRAKAEQALGNNIIASKNYYIAEKLIKEKTNSKFNNSKKQFASYQSIINERTKRFNTDYNSKEKYEDNLRGNIQNNSYQLSIQNNYDISYYSQNFTILDSKNFHLLIEQFNHKNNSKFVITNKETSLAESQEKYHLKEIETLSESINKKPNNHSFYFKRGIHYSLLKNYELAINDFNSSIKNDSNFLLAYFTRANTLYKLYNYMLSLDIKPVYKNDNSKQNYIKLIQQDYDKILELVPNFHFAFLNKGNIYFQEKDYQNAIVYYTSAINTNSYFGDAYFNRGISYLIINETNKGLQDLSKAGELGVHQAYSLIKQFQP